VLRGRLELARLPAGAGAQVGYGSPLRYYFARAVGAAQVDRVRKVDCGTITRSPSHTVRDPFSASAGEEQPHGAWIMPTRLAHRTLLTSTDPTEIGIIRTSA
jgi:hypothetical protein